MLSLYTPEQTLEYITDVSALVVMELEPSSFTRGPKLLPEQREW